MHKIFCVDCKIEKRVTVMRCYECNIKFTTRIINKLFYNNNWPFKN